MNSSQINHLSQLLNVRCVLRRPIRIIVLYL